MSQTFFRIMMIFFIIGVSSKAFAQKFLFYNLTPDQDLRIFHIQVSLPDAGIIDSEMTPKPDNPVWETFRSRLVSKY